jgi:hypothetical protein
MLELHANGCPQLSKCLLTCQTFADEEWPDAAETKAARVAEREAKTPVPERCWALRNVAGGLVVGMQACSAIAQLRYFFAAALLQSCSACLGLGCHWRAVQMRSW